jgi:hypothetical protein
MRAGQLDDAPSRAVERDGVEDQRGLRAAFDHGREGALQLIGAPRPDRLQLQAERSRRTLQRLEPGHG